MSSPTEGCLRVGQQAPDFTATAVVDQEFKTIKLSDYRGNMSSYFSIRLTSHLSALLKSQHLAIALKNSKHRHRNPRRLC
jgi:hypothetical protein